MLTDTADIRLAVAGRMMIEQLERLRDLRPIVRCHSRVRLVFHQLQDLLHTMRRILAGIMQVTRPSLAMCAPAMPRRSDVPQSSPPQPYPSVLDAVVEPLSRQLQPTCFASPSSCFHSSFVSYSVPHFLRKESLGKTDAYHLHAHQMPRFFIAIQIE